MEEQLTTSWDEAEQHLQAFQQLARRTVEAAVPVGAGVLCGHWASGEG